MYLFWIYIYLYLAHNWLLINPLDVVFFYFIRYRNQSDSDNLIFPGLKRHLPHFLFLLFRDLCCVVGVSDNLSKRRGFLYV